MQTIDRKAAGRDIQHLQETIDALHARLARLSSELEGWAQRNLEQISLDDEQILPQDAAREVVSHLHESEWIPDSRGIGQDFTPQFMDSDIAKLREARRVLSKDLEYLDKPCARYFRVPSLFAYFRDTTLGKYLRSAGGLERVLKRLFSFIHRLPVEKYALTGKGREHGYSFRASASIQLQSSHSPSECVRTCW